MHSFQQRGAALVWGLVILIALTVIGLAATQMANVDNRIAGNQMTNMLTYQGAESMLNKFTSLYDVMLTAQHGNAPTNSTTSPFTKVRKMDDIGAVSNTNPNALQAGINDNVTWNDGYADPHSQVAVSGTSKMGQEMGCPPLRGIAMTTAMGSGIGGLSCRTFTTEAHATLPGTGASSQHGEGVLKPLPKMN